MLPAPLPILISLHGFADSLNLKLTFDFHFLSSGRPLYHMGLHLFQMHGLISELKLDILKVMKFLGEQFWPC